MEKYFTQFEFTPAEVAEICCKTAMWVSRKIKAKELKAYRMGWKYTIARRDLVEFLGGEEEFRLQLDIAELTTEQKLHRALRA